MDVSKLTEYDTIVLIDRSGSMGSSAKGFASRWDAAKELTTGIASLAAKVDDDGITVITFGGQFNAGSDVVDGIKDSAAVTALFGGRGPGGSTPTAEALEAAFAKKFSSGKKAIIFVVTDGEPNDKTAVENSIIAAASKIKDASEIRVQFLQVGDDGAAANWLNSLDNNLSKAQFDIVNAITFDKADGLSAESLFERALSDSH